MIILGCFGDTTIQGKTHIYIYIHIYIYTYIHIYIYYNNTFFLVYLVRILLYTVSILRTNKLARVVNTGGVSFPWSGPTRWYPGYSKPRTNHCLGNIYIYISGQISSRPHTNRFLEPQKDSELRGSGYLGYVDSNQGYNPYKWVICPQILGL